MPKVVTNDNGRQQVETIKSDDQKARGPKPDLNAILTKADAPAESKPVEMPAPPIPPEAEKPADVTDGLEAEDRELPERAAKRIAKKHREMKEAQEAAAEADRLAESQYNRAIMAERRLAEVEAELQKGKPAPEAPKEPKMPLFKDFTDTEGKFDEVAYQNANSAYYESQAQKKLAAQKVEEQKQANAQAMKAKVDKAVEKNPDWKEVAGSITLPNPVLDYMFTSDHGTDLAYFLGKNPQIADEIKSLPAIKAIAKARDIERDQFEKPAVAPLATSKPVTPGAPAPITPIPTGGSTLIQTDPSKMSYKELRAYHKDQARAKMR